MHQLSVRFEFPNQLILDGAVQVGVVHADEMKDTTGISVLKGLHRTNYAAPIANGYQQTGPGNLVGGDLCGSNQFRAG